MRLDSYLVHCGLGSKKDVKLAIKKGVVSVNQEVIKKIDYPVQVETDRVQFDGENVIYEAHYYYLFHKPKGVICAKMDKRDKTVFDLLPERLVRQDVFMVGHLDKDTTGLLLLTTNGAWDHALRHPKKEKEKSYLLTYEGELVDDAVERVKEGIRLSDFTARSANLTLLDKNRARLILTEGKYHQVKRMIGALGGKVIDLHRERLGNLYLDIEEGTYRALTGVVIRHLGGMK